MLGNKFNQFSIVNYLFCQIWCVGKKTHNPRTYIFRYFKWWKSIWKVL